MIRRAISKNRGERSDRSFRYPSTHLGDAAGAERNDQTRQARKKKAASERQRIAEMQRRAKILLEELEQQKVQIVVPMVALGEFLVGIDQDKHGEVIAEFHRRFFCPPFDARSCALAARLERIHRELPPEERLERKLIRPDAMIIATAQVHGATTFYSDESRCLSMAREAGMKGLSLPTHSEDMFIDLAAKKATETDESE